MPNFSDLVPERIRSLGAYVPGKPISQVEAESGVKAVKLASNENPFGPSPLALAAAKQAASEVHLYPDIAATPLREKLAQEFGLALDNVLVTGGSSPLLEIVARTLTGPGLNVISSERSFMIYALATRAMGAEYRAIPMKEHRFDLDAIAAAVDANTRVIYIANPNNPTGTIVTAAEMDRFLDRLPDHVIVALDEAYYDFAQHFAGERGVEYSHSLDYVKQGRNVVVLHTFSKIYGLAALRVGYGLGPAELMGYLNRLRTPFSVTSVGEAAAMAAMDDTAHRDLTVRNNAEQSRWLMKELRALGYEPVETWANFIYCEMGEDSGALCSRLEHEGVIIRPLTGGWGAPMAIRVSIGKPEENDRFINALKKVAAGLAVR
jgi:histidinol-phosphate aminotransferase